MSWSWCIILNNIYGSRHGLYTLLSTQSNELSKRRLPTQLPHTISFIRIWKLVLCFQKHHCLHYHEIPEWTHTYRRAIFYACIRPMFLKAVVWDVCFAASRSHFHKCQATENISWCFCQVVRKQDDRFWAYLKSLAYINIFYHQQQQACNEFISKCFHRGLPASIARSISLRKRFRKHIPLVSCLTRSIFQLLKKISKEVKQYQTFISERWSFALFPTSPGKQKSPFSSSFIWREIFQFHAQLSPMLGDSDTILLNAKAMVPDR